MKKFILSIVLLILFFYCDRQWDNPISIDDDLKNTPTILLVNLVSNNIAILLDYSYSDSSTIVLERKSLGGFENIEFIKSTETTLIDSSFDREINHNFTYRVYIKKDKYRSSYSNEKQFEYTSNGLNMPENFIATSLELEGISLSWIDRSNFEDGYIIEKNDGSGFNDISSLPPNTVTYLDEITGIPSSPLQLEYRIKAFNSELESDWVNISTTYSGIGNPTNLKIISSTSSIINLEWDDNSEIETGFIIERKKDDEEYFVIDSVDANTTQFMDLVAEIGSYYYRIKAYQNELSSSYSNEVTAEVSTLVPGDGLVLYYPFNGSAVDESESGIDGTLYGPTLTTDRFGNSSSAYFFDGSNDYIKANSDELPSAERTISIWFNANLLNNFGMLIGYGGGVTGTTWHQGISSSLFSLGIHGDPYGGILYYSYQTSIIGTWIHWVITTSNVGTKMYINGVFEASNNNYVDFTNVLGKDLAIGVTVSPSGIAPYTDSAVTYFNGTIDDIRIYNRALSSLEIQALYHEGGWDE